jgi:hypothetical protein
MTPAMELVQPLKTLAIDGRPLPVTHAVLISDSESAAWSVVIVHATASPYWLGACEDECPVTFTTTSGARVGGRVAVDLSRGTNVRLVGLGAMLRALRGRVAADSVPMTAA